MAVLLHREYKGHKNIYKIDNNERKIRVEIGIPENGINEETGILVLIPGYGGNIDSHVWTRMRNEFSDLYNLITIQCDYFGNRFMGSELPHEIEKFLECKNLIKTEMRCEWKTLESEDEFNDMGMMQALDIVTATLNTISELKGMGYGFNLGKVIAFGSSHGSYLAHLANIICPNLYTCILDISAYTLPYYLFNAREVIFSNKKVRGKFVVNQFLNLYPEYKYHDLLYDLEYLYKWQRNRCKIVVFQGVDDWMVNARQKFEFTEKIENAEIMLVEQEDVDGKLFKNADHGLGLDFFLFFQFIIPIIEEVFEKKENIDIREVVKIGDERAEIIVSYKTGVPELLYISK